jgi:serine/threonine protein kinase
MGGTLKREEELFAAALALPAVERHNYLERACGGDRSLQARVESLLDAFGAAARFMEDQPWAASLSADLRVSRPEEAAGDRIGDYQLLQEIGEGGWGVVYLAEQFAPVRRQVAIKVIKLGMDTKAVIARFEAERQALAMMDHPNIARVFDAGATPAGRPYFVMELVRGIKITDYCDQSQLPTDERLLLFIQICHAIQHAHHKGIIHRDIKPSNILVTLHDGVPMVKVIDFGIAKAAHGRLTDATLYTALGQFIGTPAYVSPEQTEPGGLELDTRSDIYSLGVLLYELLTGCTPFDTNQLLLAGFDAMKQRIREEEPPTPSRRLSTLSDAVITDAAAHRRTVAGRLIRQVHGDLDWIVMRCLEKDRARRYTAANDLALDLQRFLRNEPVLARPPGVIYTFRKFARRHRLVFATGAAIVSVLLIATALSAWLAVRAIRAEKLAQTAAATRQEVINFLQNDLLAQASPTNEPDRDLKLRTVLDRAAAKVKDGFVDQPLVEASVRETLGVTYDSLGEYPIAQQQFERALQLRERQLGTDDPVTLKSMGYLASILIAQGEYQKAQPLVLQTLERQQRVLGKEHADTLGSMSNLALIYHQQGKFAAAEALLVPVLAIQKRVLGPEHQETLISMNNLALAYRNQGKFDAAAALHEQELKICARVLGPEHPDTLTSMSNVATAYSDQGKFTQSELLGVKALKISQRISGPEHPETLILMHNLASTYLDEGRFSEAEALQSQVLQSARRVMGAEHPNTLKITIVLAMIYRAQDKMALAQPLQIQMLQVAQRVMGAEHPVTLAMDANLALMYADQGKWHDAQALLTDALAISRRVFGPEHPQTLKFADQLADVLLALEQYSAAESLLRESVQRRQKTAPRHWRTFSAESQLGAALLGLHRFGEAEKLLLPSDQGLRQQADTIPAVNRSVIKKSAERIGRLRRAWRPVAAGA